MIGFVFECRVTFHFGCAVRAFDLCRSVGFVALKIYRLEEGFARRCAAGFALGWVIGWAL